MSEHRAWGAGSIADDIRTQVRAGKLQPGQVLPKRRLLARSYGVSETTIYRALLLLSWTGWTVGRQGKEVRIADPLPPDR
jgi:DNA-binding GntR family transcriptional regulator